MVGGKIEHAVDSSFLGKKQVLTVPSGQSPKQPKHNCPQCNGTRFFKAGIRYYPDGTETQRWLCRDCNHRFTQRPKPQKTLRNLEKQLKTSTYHNNSYQESNESTGRARNLLAEGYILVNSESRQDSAQREGTQQPSTTNDNNGRIVSFLWEMKQNGAKNCTIQTWSSILQKLAKHTDLSPDAVKEYLTKTTDWADITKKGAVIAYTCFLKHYGITWKPPKYNAPDKLHFIPTEAELDSLIAGSGRKLATFLQFVKETGARGGEATNTKWTDIDFERKNVHITPEKGSKARILPISDKLIDMLNSIPQRNSDKIFSPFRYVRVTYHKTRKILMSKLQNPRLKNVHIHTFRHWKATMEYHKTKDILHVQRILGHRKIECTMIYITLEEALFQNTTEDYIIKVAKTIDDACALLEVGFEYVTDMEGAKLFRKRK